MIPSLTQRDRPHTEALQEMAVSLDKVGLAGLVVTSTGSLRHASAVAAQNFVEEKWRKYAAEEYERLASKASLYGKSRTFSNRLATWKEFSGDPVAAAEILLGALPQDPTGFTRNRLATLFFTSGEIDRAQTLINEAEVPAPDDYVLLASIAIAKQDFDQAVELTNKALETDSSNYRVLLLSGFLALALQDTNRAIRFFRICSEESRGNPTPSVFLGKTYQLAGEYAKARSSWRKAAALAPLNEDIVVRAADQLLEDKRYDEAAATLNRFLRFRPDSRFCWDRLAAAHYNGGKYRKALIALKSQLKLEDGFGVRNNLALTRWKLGEVKQAVGHFEKAVEVVTKNNFPSFLPLYNAAIFFGSIHKHEMVLSLCDLIPESKLSEVAASADSSGLLVLKCEALMHLGRHDEVNACLSNLLSVQEITSTLRRRLLQLGCFFYTVVRRDIPTALENARRLLAEMKSSNRPEINRSVELRLLNNVIFVFLEADRLDDAAPILHRLASRMYEMPTLTATYGLWYLKRENVERGRELYRRAEADEADPIVKERLQQKGRLEIGKALLAQKKTRPALREIARAAKGTNTGLHAVVLEATALLKSHRKSK